MARTTGLPGMVATPQLHPAARADGFSSIWTTGEKNDLDDWTSEVLKRLSAKFRSISVIGFGRSGSPE